VGLIRLNFSSGCTRIRLRSSPWGYHTSNQSIGGRCPLSAEVSASTPLSAWRDGNPAVGRIRPAESATMGNDGWRKPSPPLGPSASLALRSSRRARAHHFLPPARL